MREVGFRVYIVDILDAIQRIDEYLTGLTFEELFLRRGGFVNVYMYRLRLNVNCEGNG